MVSFVLNKYVFFPEMEWDGAEEGEAELLCYFCGCEFRARKYFLRHHQAHIDAECSGVEMPDNSWKGIVNHESNDSSSEEDLEELEQEKRREERRRKAEREQKRKRRMEEKTQKRKKEEMKKRSRGMGRKRERREVSKEQD